MSTFDDDVVQGWNWPDVVLKYELEEHNAVVFKLTIFKHGTSTTRGNTCLDHD